MSRLRRFSFSSFCFNTTVKGSDGHPAPSNVRLSTRAHKHLRGHLTLNAPVVDVPEEKTANEDEPSKAARRLAKLESLPPLSPVGCQFAIDVRQGYFTYAHVAGEGLSRYLQDGLPGFEEVVGEKKAALIKDNIELLRRGDLEELHDVLIPGHIFYTSDKWATGEKGNAAKYPTAICTYGVWAMEQPVGATSSLENDSATEVNRRTSSSPEALTRERMVYSSDSGGESSTCLTPSDMSDEFQSSDYNSEEEQDDSALQEKLLLEMFPDRRFREDL